MIGIALFGGYVVTSLILLKYPHILHKRKRLRFSASHISHRGGSFENLENTIGAFQQYDLIVFVVLVSAVKQCQTGMLEIDVHMTRDGQVVVLHDHSLQRVAGVNKKVAELDYKELPQLKTSLSVEFMDDASCCPVGSVDTRIPLLREVFELFPDTPINIDIKHHDPVLIQKVHDLIVSHHREGHTVWGNASNKIINECYRLNPNIPVFFSGSRCVLLAVLTYTGLLPFVPLRESCFEICHPDAIYHHSVLRRATEDRFMARLVVKAVELLLLRPFLIEHLRKRGIHTYLWVLNDRASFEKAYSLGAMGVMTDRPTLLREYLNEHPQIIHRTRRTD